MPSAATVAKNVLILCEGSGLPNAALLRERTVAALRRDRADPPNISEELIDTVRSRGPEYDQQLAALYRAKYADAPPALIIALSEPALDFALRHRRTLFPDAPLLFGAVDSRAIGTRDLGPNISGMFQDADVQATLEVALRLHPRTRHLVVVGGSSRLDRGWMSAIQEDLRAFESRVAVAYMTEKTWKEVLAAVAALGEDGLVLLVSMTADADGVQTSGPESVVALRRATTAPIYGMSDSYIGNGVVGGAVIDMERHGTELGNRARNILNGVQPAEPGPGRTPNMLLFDWRELKRFGIDEARLPAGATVVNRELSVWDRRKRPVLVIGAVLVGQSLLIGGLLVQGRRRRRAEFALQTLPGRLLSAQEEERHRIARELHDNLSQQMALIAIEIEQVAVQSLRAPAALARAMRHLGERVAEISAEIHNMSHRLHSSKLDALGLAAAVRGHCREVLVHGVQVHFVELDVPESVSNDVKLCLFRIVQEGLNNVVKHSGAHEARVTLSGTTDALLLSVADFGRGFDHAAAAGRTGLGLASMRERLRLIGGELTIRSRVGQGTRIDARVPLTNTDSASTAADSVRVA